MRGLLVLALPLLVAATPVELAIHVAAGGDGAAVADDAWVADQVARAVEHFGGAEVELTWRAGDAADVPAEILSVADRNRLADLAGADGAVHVFVVDRAADKDKEGDWIGGVHWRYGGKARALRGRRYVILSRQHARDDTLAHELGHFFGLPHSDVDGNLMTPGRGDGGALDDEQRKTVRRRARTWARRREAHTR